MSHNTGFIPKIMKGKNDVLMGYNSVVNTCSVLPLYIHQNSRLVNTEKFLAVGKGNFLLQK